jgi:hypothetical protein
VPVHPPGFSERVFEFGFNSEYANANRAIIAAAPHIPTQNEEKALGYDVGFEIARHGGAVHFLALQHKTCRFVDQESATNRNFWNAIGRPYFAFRLNIDQFNVIESIASSGLDGVDFFYCVPLFSTRAAMDQHYLANTVMNHAVWINPTGMGALSDDEPHSIIFDGTSAFLFSDKPRKIPVVKPKTDRADERRAVMGAPDLFRLYEVTYGALATVLKPRRKRRSSDEFPNWRELPPFEKRRDEAHLVRALTELFSSHVGASLLVEVRS